MVRREALRERRRRPVGHRWPRTQLLTLSVAAVNFICDHPAIKAISFVGSNQAGEYIYERGSRNGKRVQSNMVSTEHLPWAATRWQHFPADD